MVAFQGGGHNLAVCRVTMEVWQFSRSDSDLTIHRNLNKTFPNKRVTPWPDLTLPIKPSLVL